MAHNLEIKNGEASFFSVKEKAWHGLGTIVENAPTSAEAIKLAKMDWGVSKAPLLANIDGLAAPVEVPGMFATYRDDNNTPLGVVGNWYTPVQNSEAFAFFDAIVGEGEAIYETAGVLGGGERIFITAKLPAHIKVGKADLIEQYIFLTNSHDGHGAITAAFTPVRIVCNNTLNAAMHQNSMKVNIRHTSSASDRLKQAHKLMGITNQMGEELTQIFNQMAKVRITDEKLLAFIREALAPTKEALVNLTTGEGPVSAQYRAAVDNCFEYAHVADSQMMDTTKGTVFGAYNAVTGYYQNVAEARSEEAKLNSISMGGGIFGKTATAFSLATSFLS